MQHKYTYVPDPGFVGTDHFTVTMTDPDGASATGTVTMRVTPKPAPVAGVLDGVRYRCAFAIRVDPVTGQPTSDPTAPVDLGTSQLVSGVMGGDVAFGVDVHARPPASVAPGARFVVPDTAITLRMGQTMAELLAGTDFTSAPAGHLPPYDEAGLGQTSVRGSAHASAVLTESATGRRYEVPMSGLASAEVPLVMPVQPDGVAIGVTGTLPTLTAPSSGTLSVAMRRR